MRYPKNYPDDWRGLAGIQNWPLLVLLYFYILFWILFGMEPEDVERLTAFFKDDQVISLEDWKRTHDV